MFIGLRGLVSLRPVLTWVRMFYVRSANALLCAFFCADVAVAMTCRLKLRNGNCGTIAVASRDPCTGSAIKAYKGCISCTSTMHRTGQLQFLFPREANVILLRYIARDRTTSI